MRIFSLFFCVRPSEQSFVKQKIKLIFLSSIFFPHKINFHVFTFTNMKKKKCFLHEKCVQSS